MTVLIVEHDPELARIWEMHLRREGVDVALAQDADSACILLSDVDITVLVVDLDLDDGAALSVADFAAYRRPDARVVFVTATTFFSDGSIFKMIPNAATLLRTDARPEDLAAIVKHHDSTSGDPEAAAAVIPAREAT